MAAWVLTETVTWSMGPHDYRTLEQGAFVRPVEECYVPKHIKEARPWFGSDMDGKTYAYTHFGFVLISKSIIREVK